MMKAYSSVNKSSIRNDQLSLTEKRENNNIAYDMPTPTEENALIRVEQIDELKLFLATATQHWDTNKPLKRFILPAGESIACVFWNDLFFITGTDIVRSLTFRFYAFGRPVTNAKKFEEGIFSDLRNLKPGLDARLEEPKSELLDMLYKNNCIRTQKKQKVFFWFSVPHDRLFLDALERDLKREKMGMEPTTHPLAEPAASISLDSTQELFDQLRKSMSQSAAATAQAIEQDINNGNGPVPNTSLSMNHVSDYDAGNDWSHIPWSASQSRLERAATQAAKRSRVNSVPTTLGQQQQFRLSQQQQQQKQHRLSHGSYFSSASSSCTNINTMRSRSTTRNYRHSSSASSLLSSSNNEDMLYHDDASSTTSANFTPKLNSPIHATFNKVDYMDPISYGVDQLEITTSLSNTSTASTVSHHVVPSKSMDSNAMKKTKTIFGNLSLFDGSPTYKQRRRRAASVSTAALNNNNTANDRMRRHDKCHRAPAVTQASTPLLNNNSSRLAMAAVKAGFAPNQIISPPSSMMTPTPNWSTPHSMDYYCPVNNCGRLFKRSDHLERHVNTAHTFICNLCGKQFPRSESLAQHHHHDHPTSLMNHDGNNDDDHSYDHRYNHNMHYNQRHNSVLNHHGNHNNDGFSPRHSIDGSRSSGWSTAGISRTGSVNDGSSCSTLSPMLDLDFDMPDVQQQQQQQRNRCDELTLLSPFKPFAHMPSQSEVTPTEDFQFVQEMMTTNEYAMESQYTPFLTSPDSMNMVFGA